MRPRVPEPYRAYPVGRAWVFARPEVAEFAREAVASAGSFFAYAATHPDRRSLSAGRGPIYHVPTPHGSWVVRRYRRGGWARGWNDRFLRIGRPRVLSELAASLEVRARGIPTPEVWAAALYAQGPIYRADIATAHIAEAQDLATLLFGSQPLQGEDRILAWAAAGRLLRWLYSLGVVHPDLNLKNVLLEHCARPARPYLLDLDRCRVVGHVSRRQRRRMLSRFRRSAVKWSQSTRRPVTGEEWHAFQVAYRTIHG